MAKTELSAIVIFDVQPLKSLHLQKDVGLIPSSIAAQTKQEALLLCLQGDESQATLLRAGLSRVGLRLVPRRFGRGSSLDSLSYALNALSMLRALATEAKRSRLLLVFHARPAFVLYALLYRCLNPGGTVWLKLDLDDGTLEHFLKKRIRFATYVRVADIVSVETRPIQKRLNAAFGHIRQVAYVPDGYDSMAYPIDQESLSAPRQNVVLTVGRLGSYQKNSECLLEAIGRLAPGSGEFRFIGEHTDEFAAKVAHAQAALPQDILLYDRINERHELFAHYAQARVFVLTSRFESFGIVLVEAMAHGCYVVSTELSSARDIIGDDEDVGLIVPQNDPEAVARAISTALGRAIDHGSIAQKAKRYYYKNIIRNLAWIPGARGATS